MYNFLESIADVVGLVGVLVILVAYFMLSIEKWAAQSMRYQFLNFLGAWLILYSLYFHWNLSAAVVEVSWIVISSVGMVKSIRKKKE